MKVEVEYEVQEVLSSSPGGRLIVWPDRPAIYPRGNVHRPPTVTPFDIMALRLGRLLPRRQWDWAGLTCRSFSSTEVNCSGHNKWSSIKHDKARNDKAKSKERAMMGKEIASATQSTFLPFQCA